MYFLFQIVFKIWNNLNNVLFVNEIFALREDRILNFINLISNIYKTGIMLTNNHVLFYVNFFTLDKRRGPPPYYHIAYYHLFSSNVNSLLLWLVKKIYISFEQHI